MSLEPLFPNFDRLIRTPEDVQHLNEAILQLAVQGKLVPQDPTDEPAFKLLKRIISEKQRLLSLGELRKQRKISSTGEYPFEVPASWEWTTMDAVTEVISGTTKGRKLAGHDTIMLPYLRVANVQRGYLDLREVKTIEIKKSERDKYLLRSGDLLLTEGGDADKVGRSTIWKGEIADCIHQNHIFRARPIGHELTAAWLMLCTNTAYGRNYFLGASKQTTNLASINSTQLRSFPVALPPLAEQHRIVARIDQLFAQTSALEAKLRRAQEQIVVVNRAALHRLEQAGNDADRGRAWVTVRDHFDRLYDDLRNVQALRQTILQLAVQGKLVPQDPNDEQIDELMDRVESAKKSLADEGLVAKPKKNRPIAQTELPYSVPESWTWCRVQELGEVRLGRQRSPKHHQGKHMRPYLRAANVTWDGVDLSDVKEMDFAPDVFVRYRLRSQDILLNEASGSYFEVGKSIIWREEIPDCCFQNTLIRVRLYALAPNYLRLHFECDARTGRFGDIAKGMSIRHLGAERLAKMPVALPPVAEQERIVAKVDQLMALCDELEARLSQGQVAQAQLTAASLYDAVDGAA